MWWLTEEECGEGQSCCKGVDCDRLVGEQARDADLLPGGGGGCLDDGDGGGSKAPIAI